MVGMQLEMLTTTALCNSHYWNIFLPMQIWLQERDAWNLGLIYLNLPVIGKTDYVAEWPNQTGVGKAYCELNKKQWMGSVNNLKHKQG
jgi:hypothetical protein